VIAAVLLGAAAVPEAGAPQNAGGGARLFQGQSSGGAADSGGMIVLLFDANSMSLTEAQSTIAWVTAWTDERPNGELASVVLIGSQLDVLRDFTADRAELGTLLRSEAFFNSLVAVNGAPQAIRFGASAATQDAARAAQPVDPQRADARLRGIRTLCTTIAPIPERKAIVFFSSGLRGGENVELLRAMTTACNRANVTINPIDARGLMNAIGRPAN
jgi:hypothetical protein